MTPKLRFNGNQITCLASRYEYALPENQLIELKPRALNRKYLTKTDLTKMAHWKSPRSAGHVGKNSEDYVKEVSGFALKAKTERARIEILTRLDGVSWPTASVILHFFHNDPYPIMDFRALWSVSLQAPVQYNFQFWWEYVLFCRKVAGRFNVDMRTLDRALWQYSKENQSDD